MIEHNCFYINWKVRFPKDSSFLFVFFFSFHVLSSAFLLAKLIKNKIKRGFVIHTGLRLSAPSLLLIVDFIYFATNVTKLIRAEEKKIREKVARKP